MLCVDADYGVDWLSSGFRVSHQLTADDSENVCDEVSRDGLRGHCDSVTMSWHVQSEVYYWKTESYSTVSTSPWGALHELSTSRRSLRQLAEIKPGVAQANSTIQI